MCALLALLEKLSIAARHSHCFEVSRSTTKADLMWEKKRNLFLHASLLSATILYRFQANINKMNRPFSLFFSRSVRLPWLPLLSVDKRSGVTRPAVV